MDFKVRKDYNADRFIEKLGPCMNVMLPLFKAAFVLLLSGSCMLISAEEPIEPIPLHPDYDVAKAAVGQQLFFDPILSRDRSISCASCHDVFNGGADSRPVSLGVGDEAGNVQSPTVLNSRYNFKQFWDGRAADLFEQASGPMHNPKELAMDEKEIEKRINANTHYVAAFERLYGPGPISFHQIIETIVEFEKALITPNSRFDRYLRGEIELTKQEMEGYLNFKELGCITCHNGVNVGGNSFQRMGTIIPYQYKATYPDLYSQNKRERFKNVFKVPTLRNIELTAPYFHDASAKTLPQAVKTMSYHNLGFELSDAQVSNIVAFMLTLTGETPAILKE